jgi:hypothetical protein
VTAVRWSLGAAGPLLKREERTEANWGADAACKDVHLDIFFREDGHPDQARAICRACPVIAQCAEFIAGVESGLGRKHRHGVFAAMTGTERWRRDPKTTGTVTQIRPERRKSRARRPQRAVPDFTADEIALFWSKTRPGPCGPEWALSVQKDGFGMFRVHSGHACATPRTAAHRLAYKLITGEDPGRREVVQACGNRRCLAAGCLIAVDRHKPAAARQQAA